MVQIVLGGGERGALMHTGSVVGKSILARLDFSFAASSLVY